MSASQPSDRRLIEVAFPLKQASLDSVHEKNVRHGHISTLHIWPARRPLAACRAALIATLLPDPGDPAQRKEMLERLGGTVKEVRKKKNLPSGKVEEVVVEETVGGILHWGRESGPDLDWFRAKIKEAYGGRAPRVLDPFAGGGAIPLEAMRLGCEATAVDINPVAWFILKCTLEYPQKLAGQTRPLPDFVLRDHGFMESFFKAQGLKGRGLKARLEELGLGEGQEPSLPGMELPNVSLEGDLAWHVRAWGWWVLQRAKADLAPFYPVIDGKPTVAYLWARTVTCKNCRATVPLLKTRWLCKKDNKRVLLTMEVVKPHPQPGQNGEPHPLAPSPLSGEGVGGEVHSPIPGYVYELCRKARVNPTPAEQLLWEVLRDRRLEGWKFRRQHPLGRYIADFYCPDARLVIELDGPIHERADQSAYDRIRDEELQARGLVVVRLKNREVEESLESAIGTILQQLPSTAGQATEEPHPHPPLHRVERGRGGEVPRVVFGIQDDVPVVGSNTAQRREYDKRIGAGTMSRSGATCPCCGAVMTREDLQHEGLANRLSSVLTCVVVDDASGKQYRLPIAEEPRLSGGLAEAGERAFSTVPFGVPNEPITVDAKGSNWCVLYGTDAFHKLFTPRQLASLGAFLGHTRTVQETIRDGGYPHTWSEAIAAYLALAFDRLISFNCINVRWKLDAEAVVDAFARFAIPILWDYAEPVPVSEYAGSYSLCFERIAVALDNALLAARLSIEPEIQLRSATRAPERTQYDLVLTDPPYYDAISYSAIMDFFYVWLRRVTRGLANDVDTAFQEPIAPKWDSPNNDGELIDDANRFDGDRSRSKEAYESGMACSFRACHVALKQDGRMVIVFANKQPEAWETLVSAIIRAGFVVDGSWPIQTEMGNRVRALSSAALSSSVWLVCKKRPPSARPGWDKAVLEEMQANIATRLREFWDAGIRGPDFVWAATGPALEAYSKYPVVKKANEPGQVLTVSEFLRQVRRIVVDFVVGRVLSHNGGEAAAGLDDVTTYYLLHRNDFGLADAPSGACILYAVSCGLSDTALAGQYDLLARSGGREEVEEEEVDEAEGEVEEGSGSKVRLKAWHQRHRLAGNAEEGPARRAARTAALMDPLFPGMEAPAPKSRPVPLIDQVHRLMHLWRAGNVVDVDEHLDGHGLRRHQLFHQLLQALIELAPAGSEERSLLESISNHVMGQAPVARRLL